MKFKSISGAALLILAAAVSHHTQAQTFPSKPVRIVVPQTPGGASDALARIVGQKLSEKWGQPVVIETAPAQAATSAWTWWPSHLAMATRC